MSQIVRQESPLNTEPFTEELASSFITPSELIFNRNHDSVIHADTPSSSGPAWTIGLSLDPDESFKSLNVSQQSLLLESLKKHHELVEVVATLECAGNRRAEFAASHQPAEGIQWGNAVIANVIWGGASLRSVLLAAGVPDPFQHQPDQKSLEPSAKASLLDSAEWARPLHLHLYSAQESTESDDPTRKEFFAASIPLTTAMHPNQHCLLAYQYNRAPLTQRHGSPLRAVIPGHVGARWVKWLNGLKISTHENDSPPMRQDYKLLVPSHAQGKDAQAEERAYSKKASNDSEFRKQQLGKERPLQRLEASCSITQPWKEGQTLQVNAEGKIEVKGYAVGQDGSPATHVYVVVLPEHDGEDISTEDLLTSLPADLDWKEAKIQTQGSIQGRLVEAESRWSWAWTLWQLDLPAPPSGKKWALIARCVTASGVQQQRVSDWNLRGFHNRSWSVMRNLSVQT
ncbi:hypothetical protein EX895_004853 [Sporisorium graminicola]|uniref:Sulfite oxidase n=1 Tax=Sporisorium graminicola TaxID=280036 RepID=A0A4U7KS10_9BASI|nr:hypothetical protein EX895_004853 [Sporisorium graminicola]TKY86028.1 hypothetical protein EX895_004853 [Sporisorium graminicola]